MCRLHELQDGTYSLEDVQLMRDIIEFNQRKRDEQENTESGAT